MKDNAWFVGFRSRETPEIVVATLLENGEHGQLAAPIVRDVIKAYFDKKARLAQPQPQIAPPTCLHSSRCGGRRNHEDKGSRGTKGSKGSRTTGKRWKRHRTASTSCIPSLRSLPSNHPWPAHRSIRDFDWALLIVALGICGLGVLQIFSATRDTIWRDAWWKQIIYIAVALLSPCGSISRIDYHTLLGQVPVLYVLSVARSGRHFRRRNDRFRIETLDSHAGFHLQVSEFVKLVMVLLVARYLTELKTEQLEWPDLLKLAGLIGIPVVLVMKQPDLGTALDVTFRCSRWVWCWPVSSGSTRR